jgi:hypothetical protein
MPVSSMISLSKVLSEKCFSPYERKTKAGGFQ